MNKEQLKKHWAIIEAFKNGAEIEVIISPLRWEVNPDPSFFTDCEYRVKPEQTGSDRVRELLETSNKHVLCGVSDISQRKADDNANYRYSTIVIRADAGTFKVSIGGAWKYAAPVDMTNIARYEK